jgi:FkbH-like protein
MSSETSNIVDALKAFRHPIVAADLLRKRVRLKRELLQQSNLQPVRLAILGGSTTSEVLSMLELFLLAQGIQPRFYESGYNRYAEEVEFVNPELWQFKPEIVYIHTTWQNIRQFPELLESQDEVEARLRCEVSRFESIWTKVHEELGAVVIQNNFDLPQMRALGNLEASAPYGAVNFVARLNVEFAKYANCNSWFLINDILSLAFQVGQADWLRPSYWYNFHMAISPLATVPLAKNLAAIVKGIYGKSKKCLVLDLDNTLWGGVVGDDGVDNLVLGKDHPVGEAFLDFQRYVKVLQKRGIILAVCSKNDPENAREGLTHPDSILRLEDFSAFKANWKPKPENIREIASELNIGLDSLVFVDDNAAERDYVAQQLPEVAVPNVGADVSGFAEIIEKERFFEVGRIVQDDLSRINFYRSNVERSVSQMTFSNYGEFLASLGMTAEIAAFTPVYFERITQLINKTNQFNLTTVRYTRADVGNVANDPACITLYGRLADKFGDNGLVSVLIARVNGKSVQIDVWLMSCRVLNREMELAMFDALVEECQARGIREIVGEFIPSKKNGMVSGHYASLGFTSLGSSEGNEFWSFKITESYASKARHIRRNLEAAIAPANIKSSRVSEMEVS